MNLEEAIGLTALEVAETIARTRREIIIAAFARTEATRRADWMRVASVIDRFGQVHRTPADWQRIWAQDLIRQFEDDDYELCRDNSAPINAECAMERAISERKNAVEIGKWNREHPQLPPP